MKKLLVGFLALGSISSFANEYYTVSRDMTCTVSGDYSSVSLETVQLPHKIDFHVNVTERRYQKKKLLSKKSKVVVAKRTTSLSENSPFQVSKSSLMRENMLDIQFEDLSREDFQELLLELGNNKNNLKPAAGIKNLKLSINQYYLEDSDYRGVTHRYTTLKKQVHYKTNVNDGLSYHLYINCGQK